MSGPHDLETRAQLPKYVLRSMYRLGVAGWQILECQTVVQRATAVCEEKPIDDDDGGTDKYLPVTNAFTEAPKGLSG